MGDREAEVPSVAAPVFGVNCRLLGSICVSGPTSRLNKAKLQAHAKNVIRAAKQLSYALAGGPDTGGGVAVASVMVWRKPQRALPIEAVGTFGLTLYTLLPNRV
jgi:hypothetical protein